MNANWVHRIDKKKSGSYGTQKNNVPFEAQISDSSNKKTHAPARVLQASWPEAEKDRALQASWPEAEKNRALQVNRVL